MPKKRRSYVKKVAGRTAGKALDRMKANPAVRDAMEVMGPAVVSWAATKIATQLTLALVARGRMSPLIARQLPWIVAAVTTAALWYTTTKVKGLKKYQAGIIAGGAVATIESMIQALLPPVAAGMGLMPYIVNAPAGGQSINGGGVTVPLAAAQTQAEVAAALGDEDDIESMGSYAGKLSSAGWGN